MSLRRKQEEKAVKPNMADYEIAVSPEGIKDLPKVESRKATLEPRHTDGGISARVTLESVLADLKSRNPELAEEFRASMEEQGLLQKSEVPTVESRHTDNEISQDALSNLDIPTVESALPTMESRRTDPVISQDAAWNLDVPTLETGRETLETRHVVVEAPLVIVESGDIELLGREGNTNFNRLLLDKVKRHLRIGTLSKLSCLELAKMVAGLYEMLRLALRRNRPIKDEVKHYSNAVSNIMSLNGDFARDNLKLRAEIDRLQNILDQNRIRYTKLVFNVGDLEERSRRLELELQEREEKLREMEVSLEKRETLVITVEKEVEKVVQNTEIVTETVELKDKLFDKSHKKGDPAFYRAFKECVEGTQKKSNGEINWSSVERRMKNRPEYAQLTADYVALSGLKKLSANTFKSWWELFTVGKEIHGKRTKWDWQEHIN